MLSPGWVLLNRPTEDRCHERADETGGGGEGGGEGRNGSLMELHSLVAELLSTVVARALSL